MLAFRRLISLFLSMLGISAVAFYLERGLLSPLTVASPFLSPNKPPSEWLEYAKDLGVATPSCPSWNDFSSMKPYCLVPWYQQYIPWLKEFLSQELPSVFSLYSNAFLVTGEIVLISGFMVVFVGVPLGILSASRHNKFSDNVIRLTSITSFSIPSFFAAWLLQVAFVFYIKAGNLPFFPTSGVLPYYSAPTCAICFSSPGSIHFFTGFALLDSLLSLNFPYFWDVIVSLFLPSLTLALAYVGIVARFTRNSMITALQSDYVRFARSKGLKERRILFAHAFRNAAAAPLTVSSLIIASMLGGSIIVEFIFALPGVGSLIYSGAAGYSPTVVTDFLVTFAMIIIITNFITDILYAMLDPRIKL
jgi:peptide/nickel transport system permease protein